MLSVILFYNDKHPFKFTTILYQKFHKYDIAKETEIKRNLAVKLNLQLTVRKLTRNRNIWIIACKSIHIQPESL